ncbi:protein MpLEA-like55 [Marchantia polymorpha subsp. ruderalis]|uniref:Late embryogenesis abundant protein LEA-2 subgroup domain-containing protein n=2 Tax=Marchantia polymorpha TaxID=3197 RepID=A0AAF6BVG4_MARPO|nr:hypothetical protein MARPO_0088s0022 [Marchantia polymorpha]BBN15998.1 hypothetical protein Mp_7g02660 [Marchantia polymorpha subsp. ruderalis]|eukprot:PTQ33473.1 hypothetical protein MARPO_0088s0022 [Marchantia polymorpha]
MGGAAKDEEKVSIKPHASSSVASEDAEVKVPLPLYRRRACHICCGISTALLLAFVILILILSFTVFKAKDPRITVTGMSLQSFAASLDPIRLSWRLDVSLHLNVTVRNPNVASFKYENSSTYLFYRGLEVGRAAIPAGKVEAKKSSEFSTYLEIKAVDVPNDANLTGDVTAGIIPVSTYSRIRGRLNVINIFKRHAISTSDCSANLIISNTTLRDFKCVYTLKM